MKLLLAKKKIKTRNQRGKGISQLSDIIGNKYCDNLDQKKSKERKGSKGGEKSDYSSIRRAV